MTNVIDKRVYFLDTSFRVLEHVSGINTEPILLRKCGDISQRKGSCHSPSLPPFFPTILSALSLPFCRCLLPLLFPEWHLSGPFKIQLQCDGYPAEFQHVGAWNMCVLSLYLPLPLSMLCFYFTCCSPQLSFSALFITGLLEMNTVIYCFFSLLPS